MDTCIFCKIITKEIETSFVYEDQQVVVIKDKNPQAPIHYLILPKKHLINIKDAQESDLALLGHMLYTARSLSKDLSDPQDFKIIINNGKSVGQCVFHLHMHFLAGKQFSK